MTNIAVIYYSATGTVYSLAQAVAEGAEKAGAEVRLRKVRELAPAEAIATNQGWAGHHADTQHVPVATADDLIWADGVVFGTPTRYGNVAAQLKQFIDATGPQWEQGLLANKIYSGFTATSTAHGGAESTLLALYNSIHHFGGIVAAPGYTHPIKFSDGNPYGSSHSGNADRETARQAAVYQGERVATLAAALSTGLAAA